MFGFVFFFVLMGTKLMPAVKLKVAWHIHILAYSPYGALADILVLMSLLLFLFKIMKFAEKEKVNFLTLPFVFPFYNKRMKKEIPKT